jgi:hypothetical protein
MANPATRRRKQTGYSTATCLGIPHSVFRSSEFEALNGWESKLLIEVAGQYNGYNNDDLGCTWLQLAPRGWRSNGTFRQAL